jgi:hypothetical protein
MSSIPNTNSKKKSNIVYELFSEASCPAISFWEINAYIYFGLFTSIIIWALFFKLNVFAIVKLPFNYQMGGIKNIYSLEYLKIGE